MMGTKERHFAPLIHVSVEELVPADHFYRHLERTLDLSFVREFVQETYVDKGRPSKWFYVNTMTRKLRDYPGSKVPFATVVA